MREKSEQGTKVRKEWTERERGGFEKVCVCVGSESVLGGIGRTGRQAESIP